MNKKLEGIVLSVKMNNTAVVEVERKSPHPFYGKIMTRSKRYKTDSKGWNLAINDRVIIVECKPLSKEKNFKVLEKLEEKK